MAKMEYFTLDELELVGNSVDTQYDKDSPTYQAFVSLREKLEYWVTEYISSRFDQPISIVRRERLNKQGGRNPYALFKNYILVGIAPEYYEMGPTMFVKLSLEWKYEPIPAPCLWIHLDVDRANKNAADDRLRGLVDTNPYTRNLEQFISIPDQLLELGSFENLTEHTFQSINNNLHHYQQILAEYQSIKIKHPIPLITEEDHTPFFKGGTGYYIIEAPKELLELDDNGNFVISAGATFKRGANQIFPIGATRYEQVKVAFSSQNKEEQGWSAITHIGLWKDSSVENYHNFEIHIEWSSNVGNTTYEFNKDHSNYFNELSISRDKNLITFLFDRNWFGHRFWFLSYSRKEWRTLNETFEIGEIANYHLEKPGERLHYLKSPSITLRNGDLVLVYLTDDRNAVAIGEVQGLSQKGIFLDGSPISFALKRFQFLETSIHLKDLLEIGLFNLLPKNLEEKFTPIPLNFWMEILRRGGVSLPTQIFEENQTFEGRFPGFSPDAVPEKEPKGYKYQNDEKLFGSLLAHRAVSPPLAIGIFGAWGSGKSHFMQATWWWIMNHLPKERSEENPYHTNILPIWFNAWHYSDANLWASLATHIFRSLEVHFQGKKQPIPEVERLQLLSQQKTHLETRKREEEAARDQLKEQSPFTLTATTQDLLRQYLPQSAQKALETGQDLRAQLHGVRGQIQGLSQLIRQPGAWVTLLLVLALSVGLALGLPQWINNSLGYWIGGALPFLSAAGLALRRVQRGLSQITMVLNEHHRAHEAKLAAADMSVKQAEAELQALQNDIENLRISGRMERIISERLAAGTYHEQLGLISVLHEDLKALSQLLEAADPNKDDKALNRIILYIDDLDRCPFPLVVEVLEAVHLLLALPLFTVVVGVDPRWVHQALKDKYNHLETHSEHADGLLGRQATTREFLQKIFQIPYTLEAWEPDRQKLLLKNLLHGQIDHQEEPTHTQPDPKQVAWGSSSEDEQNETASGDSSDKNTAQKPSQEIHEEDNRNEENTTIVDSNEAQQLGESLMLSQEEFNHLESMGPLLGTTPRAITRFLNLYRLLRATPGIALRTEETALVEDYKVLALLLAMRLHPNGEAFLNEIRKLEAEKFLSQLAEGSPLYIWLSQPGIVTEGWEHLPLARLQEASFLSAIYRFRYEGANKLPVSNPSSA